MTPAFALLLSCMGFVSLLGAGIIAWGLPFFVGVVFGAAAIFALTCWALGWIASPLEADHG